MKQKMLAVTVGALGLVTIVNADVTGNTSEKAVRSFLASSPRPDRVDTHSQVARILTVAVTPAQAKVGATQKVYYKVEVTLPPEYLARRLAYLQQEGVNGAPLNKAVRDKALSQSIERMKRNRQIVQGRAFVKKTPNGWEVLDTRSINSRLDAWALDIYYTG